MDRDAGGAYRMTFTTPGSPPRAAQVVRAVGSRRYQQYLAAEGDTLWRLAGRVPHRGEALVSDDGRVPVLGRRHHRRARKTDVRRRRRVRPPRHALERQLRLLPQRRAQPGARSVDRALQDRGRRARHRVRGLPRSGRRPRARQRRSGCGATRCTSAAAPIRRSSTRRASRPRARADLCGRCHGQRITADVGPFLTHGDPFVAGRRSGALQRAARARHAAARRGGRVRRALLGRRHPAPDRLRVPGPPAVGLRPRAALTCTSCHGMHEGDPRGQLRERFARRGRRDVHDSATRRWRRRPRWRALAPRSGGRGRALRRLPHATHRLRRARRRTAATASTSRAAARDGPTSDARPDACTLCHVEGIPGGQAGVGATLAALAGEPVARAVAADALGARRPLPPTSARAGSGRCSRRW